MRMHVQHFTELNTQTLQHCA